jgi:hypothetical protein
VNEITKQDAALSELFDCFGGKEVRIVVRVDGKRVGEWIERRQLSEQDAGAIRQWLEGQ